ncbi:hypothetical protein LQ938_11655 [Microbacterium sp. cx-55]|uniref:hypothetical protein n=1 Tax=Microbacterium sp. cx-55 TaxID=2875948 RepID=UPI001CBF8AD6|nr:hypothetical protein [Microbacterium sp. cx-55]MBZ4488072.1 hypothetical protein [Microbacterium sp. cx-55]UGB34522.1 hypothetical protein LQ938_11655 [Microbacterium sp. cx-55]
MQRRSLVVSGSVLIATLALAGCASGANAAGDGTNNAAPAPAESSQPAAPTTEDGAALTQAQAWLDAANLPEGAVRTDTPSASFSSYTGWPCGPYEELKGYWVVPATNVANVANWLIENPTADLITTSFSPVTESGSIDSAIVGYIPAVGSQEGIVYTVAKKGDDVAVRAEVAAQTSAATCPPLPGGGMYGAPGQG